MPTIDHKAVKQSWSIHQGNDLIFTCRIKIESVLQDLTSGWGFSIPIISNTGVALKTLTVGDGIELSVALGEFIVTIPGLVTTSLNAYKSLSFDIDITNPAGSERTYLIGTILNDTEKNC